jgi:hypothetical protein
LRFILAARRREGGQGAAAEDAAAFVFGHVGVGVAVAMATWGAPPSTSSASTTIAWGREAARMQSAQESGKRVGCSECREVTNRGAVASEETMRRRTAGRGTWDVGRLCGASLVSHARGVCLCLEESGPDDFTAVNPGQTTARAR